MSERDARSLETFIWTLEGRGANRCGVDLSRVDLRRADLYVADLRRANLRGANLSGANLRRADLYVADFIGADLLGADLLGANLDGADLRWVNLNGANLYEVNFSGTNLYSTKGVYAFYLSRHLGFLYNYNNEKRIQIGCENHSIEYWIENYIEIGKNHRYSDKEIEQYGKMIKLLADFDILL